MWSWQRPRPPSLSRPLMRPSHPLTEAPPLDLVARITEERMDLTHTVIKTKLVSLLLNCLPVEMAKATEKEAQREEIGRTKGDGLLEPPGTMVMIALRTPEGVVVVVPHQSGVHEEEEREGGDHLRLDRTTDLPLVVVPT